MEMNCINKIIPNNSLKPTGSAVDSIPKSASAQHRQGPAA